MNRLIVESYRNSTVNAILDDIAKKYKIDTSKDHLVKDIPIEEVKFKYRTYSECVKILYKSVGLSETKI
jgi:transposase